MLEVFSMAAVFIAAVICLVFCLIVVGAWAASLQGDSRVKTWFGIKPEYADKIMRKLLLELVIIIGIVSAGVAVAINRYNVLSEIELLTANLLTQVSGHHTPLSVVTSLKQISEIRTDLQRTVTAYNAFLTRGDGGQLTLLKKLLGDEARWNAYDYRLWAIANDLLSLETRDVTQKRSYLDEANKNYSKALALSEKGLIGRPTAELASRFEISLHGALASLFMAYGELEGTDPKKQMELWKSAREKLQKLTTEEGSREGLFLNLAATNSLLGQHNPQYFADAIRVLCETARTPRLSEEQKGLARKSILDLDKMFPELRHLQRHVQQTKQITWSQFVEQVWTPKSAMCTV